MKLILVPVFFLVSVFMGDAHPLKMAYTAVKYNKEKKVFEIGHRVFQDDFENTLKEKYGYAEDVYVHQKSTDAQKAVNLFFSKNFTLSFNHSKQKFRFLRIEQKHQMGIIIWYESERVDPAKIRTVEVYDKIMMESFREQVNMFSFNINDEIKRTLSFEFGKTSETICL